MNYQIARGKAKFLMGISNPNQLHEWLVANRELVGVAMAGRSNVGKSSLINSLFGKETARTSKTPGRTREINIFSFEIVEDNKKIHPQVFYLFDLPGYGHADVSKEMEKRWQILIDIFFQFLPPTVLVFNIQDARHPALDADLMFWKYIRQFDLEAIIAFNKIDKLKNQSEKSQLNNKIKALMKEFKKAKQVFFTSAEKGTGLKELELTLLTHFTRKASI